MHTHTCTGHMNGETWVLRPNSEPQQLWQQLQFDRSPMARAGHTLTGTKQGGSVLFGGITIINATKASTAQPHGTPATRTHTGSNAEGADSADGQHADAGERVLDPTRAVLGDTWILSCDTRRWEPVDPLANGGDTNATAPPPRHSHAAVVMDFNTTGKHEEHVLVFGGTNSSRVSPLCVCVCVCVSVVCVCVCVWVCAYRSVCASAFALMYLM